MTLTSVIKASSVIFALFSLVSCGSSSSSMNILKNVKITPQVIDGDQHVSVTSSLGMGNISLPQLTVPITSKGEDVGSIGMQPTLGGKSELTISINVSAVSDLRYEAAALPNGSALPLIGSNEVIVLPVGSKGEVYLSLVNGVYAIGASIPFSTLDSLGRSTGGISVFPVFNNGNTIASAGMYLSRSAGKNGLAVIADISSVFNGADTNSNVSASFSGFAQQAEVEGTNLDLTTYRAGRRNTKRIDRAMYRLHKRRTKLRAY